MQLVLKSLLKYVEKFKITLPQPNKSLYGAAICHLWTKPFQKQLCLVLGFAINILEIKLTKTEESIPNNEITVALLRKSKREYYSRLDVKNITDIKTFWKAVKPFLSDDVTSTQKITQIDNDKIVKNDDDTARFLKLTFFSL